MEYRAYPFQSRIYTRPEILTLCFVYRKECDEIIRWFCALAVGAKCHLRCSSLSAEQLTGILTTHEVEDMTSRMTSRYHMFCANKVRSAIAKALLLENGGEGNEADERDASAFVTNVDSRRPFRKNIHPQHAAILMHSMRNHLDVVVDQAGAMERIKATRLPIVYVAHLRTVRIGLSQIPPLFADCPE